MMGGEGCWCHFINNKFFTFRKVYFFVKGGLRFVTVFDWILAII